MRAMKLILVLGLVLLTTSTLDARNWSNSIQDNADRTIAANVVERTTKAISYRDRIDATTVRLQGTALAGARGEAKVEGKQGSIEITAQFDGLESVTRFGPEYLTYVLWAITPEGHAANLGEVILNGTKSTLNVTTELQVFALVVTAEPYFAVTQPNDLIVMENVVRQRGTGNIESIDAKYEVLPRGIYTGNVSHVKPIRLDPSTPLDLYEARNALWIALWAGADKEASASFAKAERLLQKAEAYHASRAGAEPVSMAARAAVRASEEARWIALKRRAEHRAAQGGAAAPVGD